MADRSRSKIIADNPIGKGLDAFRILLNSICKNRRIVCTPDALDQFDKDELLKLSRTVIIVAQNLLTAELLSARTGRGTLADHLSRLLISVISDDFDLDCLKPLLKAAAADDLDDTNFWDEVDRAVIESTPPPHRIASSLEQTPWLHKTSSFANSSEYRIDVDPVLKLEVGSFYVGIRHFHEKFFGRVEGLEAASDAVFKKCMEGSNPLFGAQGWSGWPADAKERDVLVWFGNIIPKLEAFAQTCGSVPTFRRKLLAQPKTPVLGSTGKRSMDIGFVNNNFIYDPQAEKTSRYRWSQILVPGDLKSNPSADILSIVRIDLATYVREVFSAQDTRRFVLGFTLCGSFMRIWAFDRLGGLSSESFDINKDGLQFISTVLGFLWMNEEDLGFDPTIITENNERYIEIERDGSKERLIIDKVMQRARCITGRATTCWKAHREGQPQMPLVIKDSWQYPERDEEGEMLREVTSPDVVNVARYYYHETVQVHGIDDDIRKNVRREIDITTAANYRPARSMPPPPPNAIASGVSMGGTSSNSNSAPSKKRSSGQIGAFLPPSKRYSSSASLMRPGGDELSNRVHRRVILRDYGKPIYEASSRSALLSALEGCIQGHESLHKAGFLHRDISINNLIINEDTDNSSRASFLIDLDLAIREQRNGASGAKGITGTRAFMAIGALLGHQHSFMHDLESFFWVLYWICIHYDKVDGKNTRRITVEFERWNYLQPQYLADTKKGKVANEEDFIASAKMNFTEFYKPLIPWINQLRKVVFPNDGRWTKEDPKLYSRMKEILEAARKDPTVAAEK